MLKIDGLALGRCKVVGLMKEQGLVSKQSQLHKYKVPTVKFQYAQPEVRC